LEIQLPALGFCSPFTLEEINLLAISPQLLLLCRQSNRIHVRQIQSMQVGAGSADPANQSDQEGRVGRPLGVGFNRGAIDEAFLKVIQTPLQNIT
jgi:hypothetical protein